MAKGNAVKSSKSPAKSGSNPPYFEMITEAISTLKDRTGSTQQAITKYIKDKYDNLLPPDFKKVLSVQLNEFVKTERLTKVKNFYKISETTQELDLTVQETQKKNSSEKKIKAKSVKTKRLSQVKTPEALKKGKKDAKKPAVREKMKRLSQVKTPEGFKKSAKKTVKPAKKVRK